MQLSAPIAPCRDATAHYAVPNGTAENGTGTITSDKTVGSVVIKFTSCESATKKCTTLGQAEGELETKKLEGTLGRSAGG